VTDRAALAIEELRAAIVLFADSVVAGDFARAELWASRAFVVAAGMPQEKLAGA
jgi:hypothetical protein